MKRKLVFVDRLLAALVRRTFVEVIEHLGASGRTGIVDGTEIRVRPPDTETGTSSSPARPSRTAVKAMVLAGSEGRVLFRRRKIPMSRTAAHPP
ncbi:hypothetical protein [Streptomyces iranensis]|uniref:Transposase IS4 family protein n=1 Tax=Streptomyces iranensis TaxID=576784 RepID=A0ABS4MNC2_9ACTN|nr:hypothetical protein [Streptomyces iranensis]MBP2061212.1 hypothetical protein [Streptomyces iranensis]